MTSGSWLRRGRHSRRRSSRRPRIPLVRPGLAVVLLLATVAVVGAVAGSARPVAAAPQPFTGTCPGGTSVCIQVTLPCQTAPCPSVVAGPTTGLATDQYVYLALANYPAGDTIRVAYCATDGSGNIDPDPNCATNTSGGTKLGKQFIVIGSNGATNAAMPVAYDPPGQGNPPLDAVPLVQNGNPATTFFCDNTPDFCDIVVTDDGGPGAGPTNTAANTVLIPLDFSAGASACPSSDPLLFSDSSFTVEHLIPAAVQATCNQKNAVVALNTATNTASEISDLAAGNTPVAFTDDPGDAQLNSELTSGATTFAYIPVALSATVVSFLGGVPDQTQSGIVFPLAQYNLTPNMVAGALTTSYEGGGTADSLVTAPTGKKPPLNCGQIVGCNKKTITNYNTFYMLNPEPTGIGQSGAIGSFFSNTSSGSNYQLSDWMCAAPNAPFDVSVQKVGSSGPEPTSVTDTYNPASTTLTTPPTQSPFWNTNTPPSEWPFKTCAPTSQFPTLSPGQLTQYQPGDAPVLQAKSIRAYGASANLALGSMDWSEASFNGLNVASLQNASGAFVSPSQASIDAALADATEQKDGTYTFDYNNVGDTGAYPMPMVTYALVPTTAIPADQAQNLTTFLTALVGFSSGNDGPLPGGYVPLTSALVTQATADIAKDIVAAPPSTTDTGGSGTTSSGGAGSTTTPSVTSSSGSPSAVVGPNGAIGTFGPGVTVAHGGTVPPTATSPAPAPAAPAPVKVVPKTKGVTAVVGAVLNVVVAGTRVLLPVLIVVAIAAMVVGPALLAWPGRRRRRPTLAGAGAMSSQGAGQ